MCLSKPGNRRCYNHSKLDFPLINNGVGTAIIFPELSQGPGNLLCSPLIKATADLFLELAKGKFQPLL